MFAAVLCGACSRSRNPAMERVAFLPFQNLTGDAALDWISSAGPTIVDDELLGGAAHAVPVQAGALRDAYAAGATQLVHGYVEKRRGSNSKEGFHFEFVVEDAQTHKTLQTLATDGDPLPSLDRLAKQIDTGAHAFSSTNPQAVAAWASGDYEKAVSLDPGFGAAWSSWVQARAAAGDPQAKQQAIDIAARALGQPSLQSPVDRAQLEFLSATLRQDESSQERALTALVRLTPHDLPLLRQLATREMSARRFSASARYYEAALQEDPDDIDMWNELGYAQAFAGDLESARKSFERYGRDPDHTANALDSEGEASFLNGKFAEQKSSSWPRTPRVALCTAVRICSKRLMPTGSKAICPEPTKCFCSIWPSAASRKTLSFCGVRLFGSIPPAAPTRLSRAFRARPLPGRTSRGRNWNCGWILPRCPTIRPHSSRPMSELLRRRTASLVYFTRLLWPKPAKRTRPES